MKKYLIIASVLVLAACSSKETAPGTEETTTPEVAPPAATANEIPTEPTKPEPPRKTVPPALSSLQTAQQGLTEAIRSQNEEAIYRASTNILAQSPTDLKAQNALGLYHYRKGHWLAAQYFFNKALQANPKSSEIYNNLGLVSLGLKEKRDAIRSFRRAIELEPNNAAAAANISALYLEEKDYAKALVGLEIAAKEFNKDYRVVNNYGVALAATGKSSQAKDQYQSALRLNSSGREAMMNLAIVEIEQLKQYQDGLDVISKLKFLGPPDSTRNRINSLESKARAGLESK